MRPGPASGPAAAVESRLRRSRRRHQPARGERGGRVGSSGRAAGDPDRHHRGREEQQHERDRRPDDVATGDRIAATGAASTGASTHRGETRARSSAPWVAMMPSGKAMKPIASGAIAAEPIMRSSAAITCGSSARSPGIDAQARYAVASAVWPSAPMKPRTTAVVRSRLPRARMSLVSRSTPGRTKMADASSR